MNGPVLQVPPRFEPLETAGAALPARHGWPVRVLQWLHLMTTKHKVRIAVAGLGHFAQSAILPAFEKVKQAELVALISGTPKKLEVLKEQYGVQHVSGYAGFETTLRNARCDAVYVAVPNAEHAQLVLRAAKAGVHVICEKPLAPSVKECEQMIAACRRARVKLMTAYRLHYERTTLKAIATARSRQIGKPKLFSSTFTQMVPKSNTRYEPVRAGGGPLYDVGIYCLNAARTLFGSEPYEVSALVTQNRKQVEEQAAVTLRFEGDRLATFAVSFVAFHDSRFELIGDKGLLLQHPAYQLTEPFEQELVVGERHRKQSLSPRDQVAGELEEFCRCVQQGRQPEASGEEGLRDVRVIEAMHESARTGRVVRLPRMPARRHQPTLRQQRRHRLHGKPKTVGVAPPHV